MRPVLAAALVVLSLAAACGDAREAPEALTPEKAAALLVDRNWMDRWPTEAKQRLEVYRFTPSMGGGVYQDRTLFVGRFELFTFDVKGDRLTIVWPDRDLREELRYRIIPVDGPAPFDLKLELDGNKVGPSVLYGRRAETGAADAFRLLR